MTNTFSVLGVAITGRRRVYQPLATRSVPRDDRYTGNLVLSIKLGIYIAKQQLHTVTIHNNYNNVYIMYYVFLLISQTYTV